MDKRLLGVCLFSLAHIDLEKLNYYANNLYHFQSLLWFSIGN